MLETVPTVKSPPGVPFTLHATARFGFPEPVTVAVNCCVEFAGTEAAVGAMLTATSLFRVTVAEALLVESARVVALMVTVAGEGRFCGAV